MPGRFDFDKRAATPGGEPMPSGAVPGLEARSDRELRCRTVGSWSRCRRLYVPETVRLVDDVHGTGGRNANAGAGSDPIADGEYVRVEDPALHGRTVRNPETGTRSLRPKPQTPRGCARVAITSVQVSDVPIGTSSTSGGAHPIPDFPLTPSRGISADLNTASSRDRDVDTLARSRKCDDVAATVNGGHHDLGHRWATGGPKEIRAFIERAALQKCTSHINAHLELAAR